MLLQKLDKTINTQKNSDFACEEIMILNIIKNGKWQISAKNHLIDGIRLRQFRFQKNINECF